MKLADHLADNYGVCNKEPCECRDPEKNRFGGWVGRGCPNWNPTTATNYEELGEWQKKFYK